MVVGRSNAVATHAVETSVLEAGAVKTGALRTIARLLLTALPALAAVLVASHAQAADYAVTVRSRLTYAMHDGARLVGDLYRPKGLTKAPVLIAIHGGGWRGGDRTFYASWAPFLARHGYAVFAIDYRVGRAGRYPAAIYDTKAAVQFVRAKAADFDIDPDRIGLVGDSAGGYLAAMVALAAERFTVLYRDDANAAVPASVKAVVGFYGIYDMLAQRQQDMTVTPGDSITQDFLGASPTQNRQLYLEAAPISHAVRDRNQIRFLLVHGDRDKLVDAASQSGAFAAALINAGFTPRFVTIPGAGHFWVSDPFEHDPHSAGAVAAPQVLDFLAGAL
jgi:acetyl esterase/lipase